MLREYSRLYKITQTFWKNKKTANNFHLWLSWQDRPHPPSAPSPNLGEGNPHQLTGIKKDTREQRELRRLGELGELGELINHSSLRTLRTLRTPIITVSGLFGGIFVPKEGASPQPTLRR